MTPVHRHLPWGALVLLALGAIFPIDAVSRTDGETAPAAVVNAADDTMPPVARDSVRFAVLGDTGTGGSAQRQVGTFLRSGFSPV